MKTKQPNRLEHSSFWILPIIASLVAFGPLSTDMYLPAQIAIKDEFGASIDQIQLTLSIFLLGTSVALTFWGPLADRFGRRVIMFTGITLFVIASVGCALSTSIEMLIVFRFIQAIGACVGPVIGRTIVRDIYGIEKSAKAFGYLASIMALAPAIAPILGGFLLLTFNWRAIFYMLALLAIICTTIYFFTIGETLKPGFRQSIKPGHIWFNYKALIRDRIFISYTLVMSTIFSGLFSFISSASFIFIDFLKLSEQQFGFCFLGMVIGFILGASSAARLSGKIAPTRLILSGISLCSAAALLCVSLAFFEVFHVMAVIIPIAIYASGVGFVLPQCSAASMKNFPQVAGTAASLMGIIQNTLAASAGLAVAFLHQDTPLVMALFLCIAAVLALLFFRFLIPASEKQSFLRYQ